MRHVSRVTLLLLSASLLAGCGGGLGLFKKKDKITVPGERTAVLVNEAEIAIDTATATETMTLPAAVTNDSWAQSGGNILEPGLNWHFAYSTRHSVTSGIARLQLILERSRHGSL